LDFGRQIT